MRIAVTGVAGFIGAKVAAGLLGRGHDVVGLDSFEHDDGYPAALKHRRARRLQQRGATILAGDIGEDSDVRTLFARRPHAVVHLAAKGGLRRSMAEPAAFLSTNVAGFGKVIDAAAAGGVDNFVYASSGAVYGGTDALPFSEDDPAAWPLSLYGATKRADELLAFVYARTAGLRCTGLRFATVYGTDGRPDMAVYRFARRIAAGEPIALHGQGRMLRDFVWGDDAARCTVLATEDRAAFGAGGGAGAPWRVLNIGTGRSVTLMELVGLVEAAVGRAAQVTLTDALTSEVQENRVDVTAVRQALGFAPAVAVEDGVPLAVRWWLRHLESADRRSVGATAEAGGR